MDKIKFFAWFLAFLTVLFILWLPVHKTYFHAIVYAANVFFWIMGYPTPYIIITDLPSEMTIWTTHLVPFMALVLATPKIQPKMKGKIILAGSLILFLSQVSIMVGYYMAHMQDSYLAHIITAFMIDVGVVVLPFALWFVLVYKDVMPERKGEEGKRGFIGFMKKLYATNDRRTGTESASSPSSPD